jgi:hypothetical protein
MAVRGYRKGRFATVMIKRALPSFGSGPSASLRRRHMSLIPREVWRHHVDMQPIPHPKPARAKSFKVVPHQTAFASGVNAANFNSVAEALELEAMAALAQPPEIAASRQS